LNKIDGVHGKDDQRPGKELQEQKRLPKKEKEILHLIVKVIVTRGMMRVSQEGERRWLPAQ